MRTVNLGTRTSEHNHLIRMTSSSTISRNSSGSTSGLTISSSMRPCLLRLAAMLLMLPLAMTTWAAKDYKSTLTVSVKTGAGTVYVGNSTSYDGGNSTNSTGKAYTQTTKGPSAATHTFYINAVPATDYRFDGWTFYPSASRSLAVSNVYTPQSSNGIISLSSKKVVHSYGVGSSSAVNNSSKISSATSKSSTSNVSSVASTLLSTPGSSISFPLYASNATQIQEEKYGAMSSPVYKDYRFVNKTGSLSGLANADLRKLYNQDGLVSYSHIQLPSIKRRIGGGISTTELEWFKEYLASIGITWTGNYSDLEQFLYDDDDGNQYFTPEFVQAYYDWLAQTMGSGIFPDWMKDSIIRAPIGEGQVLLFFLLFYSFILFIRNKHKNTILS